MNNTETKYKIDLEAVLQEAKKLPDDFSFEEAKKIIELLGGKRLFDVFSKETIYAILENLKKYQVFYISGGESLSITILEDLLNNQIPENLEKFLCIKPEYIENLPEEQKIKIAKSFAGSIKDETELLVNLWKCGVQTIACGGESKFVYLYIKIKKSDIENFARVCEFARKNNYPLSFTFQDDTSIALNISGNQLDFDFYSKFNQEIQHANDYATSAFYSSILKNFCLILPNFYEYYYGNHDRGYAFTEEELIAGLTENNQRLMSRIVTQNKENDDLQYLLDVEVDLNEEVIQQLEEEQEKNKRLQRQNRELRQQLSTIREFVIYKLGRVPVLGRIILGALGRELVGNQNLLSAEKEEERENS